MKTLFAFCQAILALCSSCPLMRRLPGSDHAFLYRSLSCPLNMAMLHTYLSIHRFRHARGPIPTSKAPQTRCRITAETYGEVLLLACPTHAQRSAQGCLASCNASTHESWNWSKTVPRYVHRGTTVTQHSVRSCNETGGTLAAC